MNAQLELPLSKSLADEADRWMHTLGGRHIMRDLYALAARYSKDWKRTGIPVSMKLIYELERHRIKLVEARAARLRVIVKDAYGYTLNNDHTAYIARHMMSHRFDWVGMFETRKLKNVSGQPRLAQGDKP